MDGSTRSLIRGRLDILIGIALLAAGLLVLSLPVYLDTYDRYGMQLKCGNGYVTQLLQATIDDQNPAPYSGATNYVDQCKSALLHRRALTLPVTATGTLILIFELVAWMRGRSPGSSESGSEWPADHTEEELHDAAVLDRRYRSHRERPHDTTL
ncbi:MAG: hypothetical protein ACRDTV_26430 [Mycobacterium sp.]